MNPLLWSSCLKVQVYKFWLWAKQRPCTLFTVPAPSAIHAMWSSTQTVSPWQHLLYIDQPSRCVYLFFSISTPAAFEPQQTVSVLQSADKGLPSARPPVAPATFLSRQTLSLHTRGSPRKWESFSCCVVVAIVPVAQVKAGAPTSCLFWFIYSTEGGTTARDTPERRHGSEWWRGPPLPKPCSLTCCTINHRRSPEGHLRSLWSDDLQIGCNPRGARLTFIRKCVQRVCHGHWGCGRLAAVRTLTRAICNPGLPPTTTHKCTHTLACALQMISCNRWL